MSKNNCREKMKNNLNNNLISGAALEIEISGGKDIDTSFREFIEMIFFFLRFKNSTVRVFFNYHEKHKNETITY
jgi:hypothetical protein